MNKRNQPGGAIVPASPKTSSALARIRGAKLAKPLAGQKPAQDSLVTAALTPTRRPRLVFAFDATASRAPAWEVAKQATDGLFRMVPGELDVALAVHGAGSVHTFTPFSPDPHSLRDAAASVACQAGMTALVELMDQVLDKTAIKVMLYIGDAFEESPDEAYSRADSFRARGIKAIMLHDSMTGDPASRAVFEEIARRTGGVCVDFHGAHGNVNPADELRELLDAVAVLTLGGVKLLEQRKAALPGAKRLLPYLK